MSVKLQGIKNNGDPFEQVIDPSLEWLDLYDKQLAMIDLSPLVNCPNVQVIELGENELSTIDLEPLQHCPHLKKLDLSGNDLAIINLKPIKHCLELEHLNLANNQLASVDLPSLAYLSKLTKLDIRKNRLSSIDLQPLRMCYNLRELIISGNLLMNISIQALSKCKNLEKLDLDNNRLTKIDLFPLGECSNLRELYIKENWLAKISLEPLNNCTKLAWIDLRDNRLTRLDLSPLSNCPELSRLELENNKFEKIDLAPLRKSTKLQWFKLNMEQLGAIRWKSSEPINQKTFPEGLKPYKTQIAQAQNLHLLKLKKLEESPDEKRHAVISVLGSANSGKTTFLRFLETNTTVKSRPRPTLGIETRQEAITKDNWRLSIIDVGGQDIYITAFWDTAIKQADGLIYVLDGTISPATNSSMFPVVKKQLELFLQKMNGEKPLLIVVNKQDQKASRPITANEAIQLYGLSKLHGLTFNIVAVSALLGNGVNSGIDWLIRKLEEIKN